jgi:hypothetical protein
LELAVSNNQTQSAMVDKIESQLAEKQALYDQLKAKLDAYKDASLNPRYAEIRRQYAELQKRIDAFKM